MNEIEIQVLETSFRGYPRNSLCEWSLHYNITFACKTPGVPDFFAQEINDIKGFFQIPQSSCAIGMWGQFEKVDIYSDDILFGHKRVWRAHAHVTVKRYLIDNVCARVKMLYSFHLLNQYLWFKTDVVFRALLFEHIEKKWGKDYLKKNIRETTLSYSGPEPCYSIVRRRN
jgi:hypothetical protein